MFHSFITGSLLQAERTLTCRPVQCGLSSIPVKKRKVNRFSLYISTFSSPLIYSITSSTRQSKILQNISMVWVLTLSFRFSRVICAGLILYFLIRVYWVIPFSRMVFHSLAYEIITFKPHFLLECYPNTVYNDINQYRLFCCDMKGECI